MDVILHVIRAIIVDDEFEFLDVQPSGRDRGGDDNRHESRLEIRNRLVPIDLILSTVQRRANVPLAHQISEQVVGRFLSFHKDQCSEIIRLVLVLFAHLAEDLEQAHKLVVGIKDLDALFDLLCNDGSTADGDLEWFRKDLSGERVHLGRESGREQDGLTIWPDIVDDFHHLRRRQP
jgi:hypothetical protein